jgi:hypothetical protein
MIYSSQFAVWKAEALRRGYTVEPDGTGRVVAHVDGDNKGEFGAYGGAFAGWFTEAGQ